MLRPADRFTVGMAQVPALRRRDVAADEFTIDKLGALAGGTASTAHPALRDDRGESPAPSAMFRAGVPCLFGLPPEPHAPPRAEALVHSDGREVVPAVVAPTLPEVERNAAPQPCRTSDLAPRTQPLVPVAREESERTAATGLLHDHSPRFTNDIGRFQG